MQTFPEQSYLISYSPSYGCKIVHNSSADPTFQDPEWPTDPFDDYPTGEGLVNKDIYLMLRVIDIYLNQTDLWCILPVLMLRVTDIYLNQTD
jgi:hypothetical protein